METQQLVGEDRRNDPRPTEELIQIALLEPGNTASDAVAALHYRGSQEVFDAALDLLRSEYPRARAVGSDILGQLGVPNRTFPEETQELFSYLLETETDSEVLYAVCTAISHNSEFGILQPLTRLKDHPDPDIRLGVVYGLLHQKDDLSARTLTELSTDEDARVRDWATFGLGELRDMDTPELRDALASRLSDPDEVVRNEARKGLARREDFRAVQPLVEALSADSIFDLDLEAAKELGHPDLLPVLLTLAEWWSGEGREVLEEATLTARVRQENPEPAPAFVWADLRLLPVAEGGPADPITPGFKGRVRLENGLEMDAQIVAGPLQLSSEAFEEVKVDLFSDLKRDEEHVYEELELLDGEQTIGRGTIHRIHWRSTSYSPPGH